jgi:hypothetical protein
MDGISHRGEGYTSIIGQTADQDPSCMQPYAHWQCLRQRERRLGAERVQTLLQRACRQHGALGVILMSQWRPKQDQRAVVQDALQRPSIALDLLDDQREEPLHPLVQRLGIQVLYPHGDIGQGTDEGGHHLALSQEEMRMRGADT